MAGMFYTLIEVAEKLGRSEDQIRQMVQDGKLREFRDGPKLLFKKDEVDAMAGQGDVPDDTLGLEDDAAEGSTFGLASDEDISQVEGAEETEPISSDDDFDLELDASGLDLALGGSDIDLDLAESRVGEEFDLGDDTDVEDSDQDEQEPVDEQAGEEDSELDLEPIDEEPAQTEEETKPAAQDSDELELAEESDLGINLEPEDETPVGSSESDQFAAALEDSGDLELGDMQLGEEDEFGDIELSDTSDSEGTKSETEGINVLGEEDSGYKLTDDSLGETAEVTLESDEPSLDDDVNLESFGSGSGLLDLSLQADDTSLGAVLDDIIPGAGGGDDAGMEMPEDDMLAGAAEGIEEPAPVEAAPVEEVGGGMEDFGQPAAAQGGYGAAAMTYAEPAPDSSSNIFGSMLILPLLISIFTIIVSMAGANGISPGLLDVSQGIIWFVAGGLAVVALIWMFVGIAAGGSKSPSKAKKSKSAKAAKPKKEKKPKKTKKAKAAKPKKEKKKKK